MQNATIDWVDELNRISAVSNTAIEQLAARLRVDDELRIPEQLIGAIDKMYKELGSILGEYDMTEIGKLQLCASIAIAEAAWRAKCGAPEADNRRRLRAMRRWTKLADKAGV
jgi:hypothetical protein